MSEGELRYPDSGGCENLTIGAMSHGAVGGWRGSIGSVAGFTPRNTTIQGKLLSDPALKSLYQNGMNFVLPGGEASDSPNPLIYPNPKP